MIQPTIFSHLPMCQAHIQLSHEASTEPLSRRAARGADVLAVRRAGGPFSRARAGVVPSVPVHLPARTSHLPAR